MFIISEFGLKIKNIEAGTLYEYNLGLRNRYSYVDAMFTNSLFKDFLEKNGLNVWKGESTRDIICLEFNFGTRSYEEQILHLEKLLEEEKDNPEKIAKLLTLKRTTELNKDKYIKRSADEIRTEYYVNGVDVRYITRDKAGEIKKEETIHYKMLYRTTGKAKKGSCMFINEKLYEVAKNFLTMGIQLPYENTPIVEMGAYSSLVTSTIVGKIHINPRNILVLKDVDSFFKTKVVSIETNEQKQCIARTIQDYKLKNTLFDGEALIDSSSFPSWGKGYILLRQHLCKMAAFCSNIQLFFKDYYGDKYDTATVKDMFGNDHFVKDIQLITTDNAMKWLKFDVSYDYWCNKVHENGDYFGIVKTAHKSKLGEVQRMSYQMVNSLDSGIMENVIAKSVDYIEKLKSDENFFLQHLRDNSNFANDFDVLVALVEQNREFLRSEYFRERQKRIVQNYVHDFKTGKIIQDADNLVIVGSPYAMLLHAVGEDVGKDDTFCIEDGVIQCYTERFQDNEYLAAFRSPFNGQNNMVHLHNVLNKKISKYFNFGEQIIAVNLIHTDLQDRANGSDQDSDSFYVTNQPDIVRHAKYCYEHFPTIVNNIPMEKNSYTNTLENYAKIDNELAAASRAIGESSNLAQLALTYSFNFAEHKYLDYVCILSVLAQAAIDNAKRRFDVDIVSEIQRIKEDMQVKEHGYPVFWKLIRPDFNSERINLKLNCPMNYLCTVKMKKFMFKEPELPMEHFFIKHKLDVNRRKSRKVEELIEKYSLNLYLSRKQGNKNLIDYLIIEEEFEKLITDIRQIKISKNYLGLMSWLIDRALVISPAIRRNLEQVDSNLNKNRMILLKTLYELNKDNFLCCFKTE